MTTYINLNNEFTTVKFANVHELFGAVRCAMDPIWQGRNERIEVVVGLRKMVFDATDSWTHVFNWVSMAQKTAIY